IYDGPKDPASGERPIVGGPQPGSELAWAGLFVPVSADQPIVSQQIAEQSIRSLVYETNPPEDFKLANPRFDKSTFERRRPLHALYDATNPDLAP
uniref:tannase/feruloyl esterase family alpha/beta hydrolase n=1 Tax=Pseudomonas viridiflava TaxID=33069 RepID=UPI000F03E295